MTQLVYPKMVADVDFYNITSTTPRYAQGEEICITSSQTAQISKYKYIKASVALVANQPYVLTQTGTGIKAIAPATSTVGAKVAVPQVAIPQGSYGFVCVEGPCKANVTGTLAVNNFLEVLNASTAFSVDGEAETVNSAAVATAASSANGVADIILIGKTTQVAAS